MARQTNFLVILCVFSTCFVGLVTASPDPCGAGNLPLPPDIAGGAVEDIYDQTATFGNDSHNNAGCAPAAISPGLASGAAVLSEAMNAGAVGLAGTISGMSTDPNTIAQNEQNGVQAIYVSAILIILPAFITCQYAIDSAQICTLDNTITWSAYYEGNPPRCPIILPEEEGGVVGTSAKLANDGAGWECFIAPYAMAYALYGANLTSDGALASAQGAESIWNPLLASADYFANHAGDLPNDVTNAPNSLSSVINAQKDLSCVYLVGAPGCIP
jgi:hypothetical protein